MPNMPLRVKPNLPIKRYTSASEAIRDLYKIGRSLNISVSAAKLKAPKDIFDSDLDDDVLKSVPDRALPGKKNAKVIDKKDKPVPARNVVKPVKKATLQEDDEAPAPRSITKNAPSNKKLPKEDEEIIDDTTDVPAKVDNETKDLEDNAPSFNYTGKDSDSDVPDTLDVGDQHRDNLNKWNEQLKDLFDKREKITNILNTLSHSFKSNYDDDEKYVNQAIILGKNIQAKIKEAINDIRKRINNATEIVLPSNFKRFINAVTKSVESMFNKKYKGLSLIFQGGNNKNGNFQLTAFIVLTNLKMETGGMSNETLPYYVIAISIIGNSYYINPALYRLPVNSEFTPGFRVANTKEAVRYIEEQMMFSGNVDSLATIGVPAPLTKIGINAIKDVTNVEFTKTDIIVTLKSVSRAKDIANQIYTVLYSALYSHDPKDAKSIKIKYEVVVADNKCYVVYKFVRGDKFSGRTLHNDEVDLLRKIFTDEDINKIQYMLTSSKVKKVSGKGAQ